jgi:hypothetical protein
VSDTTDDTHRTTTNDTRVCVEGGPYLRPREALWNWWP